MILGPQSLSFPTFGAPSRGAFVLVHLKGETLRRVVIDRLVAVGAEFFLFPWGFVPTAVDAAATFASAAAAAAAVATTTLGECCHETCVQCHDFQYLFALLRKFGL
jgi:hypothetical protein